MSIREALIAVVALVMMAPPTIAANAKLKYALECGFAPETPHHSISDKFSSSARDFSTLPWL